MSKTKRPPTRDGVAEFREIAELTDAIETKRTEMESCRRQARSLAQEIRKLESDRSRAVATAKQANLFGDGPLTKH